LPTPSPAKALRGSKNPAFPLKPPEGNIRENFEPKSDPPLRHPRVPAVARFFLDPLICIALISPEDLPKSGAGKSIQEKYTKSRPYASTSTA
jgi:hypothetical protein